MKTPLILIAVLTAALMTFPSQAFVNPITGEHDTLFEQFGPRIDKIFIKMYASSGAELDALKNGLIDVTDFWLPQPNQWIPDPNVTLVTAHGLAQSGFIQFAMNENNASTLGPPGPPDPNPKFPNPMADVHLRNAIAHLINWTFLWTDHPLVPMHTPVLPYLDGWIHSNITVRPYSPELASEILDGSGYPIDPASGWRFPDYDGDGVKDSDEKWDDDDSLDLYVRLDVFRKMAGEHLAINLQGVNVPVELIYCTGWMGYQKVFIEKDFHIYTEGWILSDFREGATYGPDYLYPLYYSGGYWHDWEVAPTNYCRINDTILDEYLLGIVNNTFAHGADFNWPDYPDPVTKYVNSSCWAAQERIYNMTHGIPLFSILGVKAMHKTYVGDGIYADKLWMHFATQTAFGVNSFWTFLNGFPEGYPYGVPEEPMTIHYGWSTASYPFSLNVLYAEYYWDYDVLGKIYDTLGMRNPYDCCEIIPWMIYNYSIGTYPIGPRECTKLLISLRNDIKWSDGQPLTMADVVFSLIESTKLLIDLGYSPPSWYAISGSILSYTLIDPCTAEILFNVSSYWMATRTLTCIPIFPKHIWEEIIKHEDPTGFMPDTTMTGSGPFKYVSMIPGVSLVMDANENYFRYLPILPEFNTTQGHPKCKADPGYPNMWASVTVDFVVNNLWLNETGDGHLRVKIYIYVDDVLRYIYSGIPIKCGSRFVATHTFNMTKCFHRFNLSVYIEGPEYLQPGVVNPWIGKWANATLPIWVTIKYDIAGANYLGKVVAPDCKVEGKDNAFVAAAYNTKPGDARWKANADVNGDYKIEGKDAAWIAKYYGKW